MLVTGVAISFLAAEFKENNSFFSVNKKNYFKTVLYTDERSASA